MSESVIGQSIGRKDAWEKATGRAKYTDDSFAPELLHARIVTSVYAHALIKRIDTAEAKLLEGVKAVVTSSSQNALSGAVLEDRSALAAGKVRYFGEPIAIVVARSEHAAAEGAGLVRVDYEELPAVYSPTKAITPGAPLVHETVSDYKHAAQDVYPERDSNVASRYKIRKGEMDRGWTESDIVIEECFELPQSDHAAMEVRCAKAEILPDGMVTITSSTQSPYVVKKQLSQMFSLDEGKINVHAPLVGGAFGGKAPVTVEILAYMASKAVGGLPVRLVIDREQDIATFPCRIGLEAKIKLGAARDGTLKAAEMTFLLDAGAYADISPRMAKAIAVDCTGPYNIENLSCDVLCVYTNHTYSTSFRGFAHESYTFCVERTLDILARKLGLDPLALRMKNAIKSGHLSPTQVKITSSNTGNLRACIDKLKTLIGWDEGVKIKIDGGKVRAKGIACLWKTPDPPTDSSAGAVLTFNEDGSINLCTGVVEFGSGSKTKLAQLLAEKMKMDVNRIYIKDVVETRCDPMYWKTVASMTLYMAGRAVLDAAEDLISQLKNIGAVALRCLSEDLEVGQETVFVRHDPQYFIGFKDIVHGLKYPGGNAVGKQIIGRGSFVVKHLTTLDPETGKGKAGPAWTVGAQAVEVEYDARDCTYRLLKAASVLDVGKVINPAIAEAVVKGGMGMGLSLASREKFVYNEKGELQTTSLRTYKLLHIGQEPKFLVSFVETPQEDAPYGARGFSEHGVIGIPAALGNALSAAAGVELNKLPLTPEGIWRAMTKGERVNLELPV